jgi:hypothetical protein
MPLGRFLLLGGKEPALVAVLAKAGQYTHTALLVNTGFDILHGISEPNRKPDGLGETKDQGPQRPLVSGDGKGGLF